MDKNCTVLYLSKTESGRDGAFEGVKYCSSVLALLKELLTLPKRFELDNNPNNLEINIPIITLINPDWTPSGDGVDSLSISDIQKLLKFRFFSLNLIIKVIDLSNAKFDESLDRDITLVSNNIKSRLLRIKSWIGLLPRSNGSFINSMPNFLKDIRLNTPPQISTEDISKFTKMLIECINYDELLDLPFDHSHYSSKINKWEFNAYEFSHDELIIIGAIILSDSKYENSIKGNVLLSFLFFVRDNYHIGNPFHNFRHAIDVLQATNIYLSKINNGKYKINPIDSYSLLLASIGHDIGHPGITNAFLINNSTPLALYYENISVLEQFHHFQFEQIRTPYFEYIKNKDNDEISKLIHSSILATDMARHDSFVDKIPNLDKKSNNFELLACLLIKSADISNVCRPLSPSCKWGLSLGEEFKQVAKLEKSILNCHLNSDDGWSNNECDCGAMSVGDCSGESPLDSDDNLNGLGSSIGGFPICEIDVDQSVELVPGLSGSQLFFIDRFAINFFSKIGDAIEELDFLNQHLESNAVYWKSKQ